MWKGSTCPFTIVTQQYIFFQLVIKSCGFVLFNVLFSVLSSLFASWLECCCSLLLCVLAYCLIQARTYLIRRSLWNVSLLIYYDAAAMVLSALFCDLCIMSTLDFLAYPRSWILQVQMGIIATLYSSILLFIVNGDLQPSNQSIFRSFRSTFGCDMSFPSHSLVQVNFKVFNVVCGGYTFVINYDLRVCYMPGCKDYVRRFANIHFYLPFLSPISYFVKALLWKFCRFIRFTMDCCDGRVICECCNFDLVRLREVSRYSVDIVWIPVRYPEGLQPVFFVQQSTSLCLTLTLGRIPRVYRNYAVVEILVCIVNQHAIHDQMPDSHR